MVEAKKSVHPESGESAGLSSFNDGSATYQTMDIKSNIHVDNTDYPVQGSNRTARGFMKKVFTFVAVSAVIGVVAYSSSLPRGTRP